MAVSYRQATHSSLVALLAFVLALPGLHTGDSVRQPRIVLLCMDIVVLSAAHYRRNGQAIKRLQILAFEPVPVGIDLIACIPILLNLNGLSHYWKMGGILLPLLRLLLLLLSLHLLLLLFFLLLFLLLFLVANHLLQFVFVLLPEDACALFPL